MQCKIRGAVDGLDGVIASTRSKEQSKADKRMAWLQLSDATSTIDISISLSLACTFGPWFRFNATDCTQASAIMRAGRTKGGLWAVQTASTGGIEFQIQKRLINSWSNRSKITTDKVEERLLLATPDNWISTGWHNDPISRCDILVRGFPRRTTMPRSRPSLWRDGGRGAGVRRHQGSQGNVGQLTKSNGWLSFGLLGVVAIVGCRREPQFRCR